MADTLKERKIYRILTNATSKAWDKIAFWTTAKSVDAADGNNLETKVGAIKGITTSTNTTTKGYAADATVIKTLNDSLGGYKFTTKDGKIAYYKASAGADSAVPFSSGNGNLRIDFSVSGSIATYDRGHTWLFSIGTLSIYLLDNKPASTEFSATGGASLNTAHSGYQTGTVYLYLSVSKIYSIDADKNIIKTLYSAS